MNTPAFLINVKETQRVLFALAYEGKNLEGTPNTYLTDKEMKSWFSPLKKIDAAEKRSKKRKKVI